MLSPTIVRNAMTAAMTEIITSTFDIKTHSPVEIAIAAPPGDSKLGAESATELPDLCRSHSD